MNIEQIFLLCGGLALFLYGMSLMSSGFEKTAGDRLRGWLGMLTNKRLVGVLVGTGVTAVIQSSSATTVMVVGFVNAGLMTLKQAVGVIMGANIGTTVTGLIIAIKLTMIAPVFLLAGVIMILFVKKRSVENLGYVVAGFGMLFLGMSLMSNSFSALKDAPWFINLITSMNKPLFGVLIGAVLTAIIQSSSAFTGILIALAFQGLIGIDAAFPLVLGSNVGTCITAALASIGTSANARRAAFIHFIFNLAGVVVFLLLSIFISWPDVMAALAGPKTQWQISFFHVIFNVVNTAMFLPFADKLVWFAEKLIPMHEDEASKALRLEYIDERMFTSPALIVPQLLLELERMLGLVKKNLTNSIDAFINLDASKAEQLREREETINYLYHELTQVLVKASAFDLSKKDHVIVGELYHVISDLERIGDHAENIIEYVEIAISNKLTFSQSALDEVRQMSAEVLKLFELSTKAYMERDFSKIDDAYIIEHEVDNMQKVFKENHIRRLNDGECSPHSSMIFTDLLTDLERMGDHSYNIIKY